MRQVNCTLLAHGQPVLPGTVLTTTLTPDLVDHVFNGVVEEPGRLIFRLPDGPLTGAWIDVVAPGFNPWADRVVVPAAGAVEGPLIELQAQAPQGLHVIDVGFVTEAGHAWTYKGATDFLAYLRYLQQPDDLAPICAERAAAGANTLRVLGMCAYITGFHPQAWGAAFYDQLPGFAAFLGRYGLYLAFDVFADAQLVMPDRGDQQHHFLAVCEAFRGVPNVLVKLGNEWPKNGFHPTDFLQPSWLLASQGSTTADAPPPQPGWSFHDWHGRRDLPKVTSSFEDAWYVSQGYGPAGASSQQPGYYPRRPIIHDEPMGFDEVEQPGRRSTSPRLAAQLAATAVYLGAGGTFHSEAGLRSQPWGPTQRHCAAVFFARLAEGA